MRSLSTIATFAAFVNAGKYALSQDLTCPAGYELLGKKCEKTTIVPSTMQCVLGTLRGDVCVQATETLVQCPFGSINQGNACVASTSVPAVPTCPHGYTQDGFICKKQIPLEVVDLCTTGKPDGEGNCLIVDRVSRLRKVTCPQGYSLEGDACARVSEYDCSPQEPPLVVPKLMEVVEQQPVIVQQPIAPKPIIVTQGHSHGGHHRSLNGGRLRGGHGHGHSVTYVQPRPLPIIPQPQPIVQKVVEEVVIEPPVIPSSVAVVKQICRRQDFANLIEESMCPEGYFEDGQYCARTTKIPMSRQCVNGGPPEACYKFETVKPSYICKTGELIDGECVIRTTLPLERVCPPGTRPEGGMCVSITSPQLICPTGTILDGTNCIGKQTAEPVGIIETPCIGKECFAEF